MSADLNENNIADFLLAKKHYLTALEFHQELLEGNNGVHNVSSLNRFFNEPTNYTTILRATEELAQKNRNECMYLDQRI